MIKKTVTYIDYNDKERTEDFYFNLTKAELMEMEMGVSGGMSEMCKRIVAAQDSRELIDTFKMILMKAYGEKSPDGKRFMKSKDISEAFAQTEAYSDLFMELATDAQVAADFINGLLPSSKPA